MTAPNSPTVISAAVTQQDLIDRAVTVETPVIKARKETTDLWRDFDAEHPRLVGALLTLFAEALAKLPEVELPAEERPRLAEFARLGMACAMASGESGEKFMKQFNASRLESIARTIDSSPVASALIDWFEARKLQEAEMPLKELLMQAEQFKPQGTDAWPRSAKGFGDALRRAAPALRQLDIEVVSLGKTGGTVKWKVSPRRKSSEQSPASPEVLLSAEKRGNEQDIRTFRTSSARLSPAGAGPEEPF